MLTAAEIVVTSITTLVFGLLLIIATLRLRSQEPAIFHLTLYMILSLALSASVLLSLLSLTNLLRGTAYNLIAQFVALAMILSFGALTLSFLKKNRRTQIIYWIIALVILTLTGMVTGLSGRWMV